ncbi:hypothetical protein [Micromonospora kangleipakensis]|nr:hypothetical protein [Micromonospora kangleipakensis]
MLVFTRSPTGEWIPWRVGRQRLAWRPVLRAPWRTYMYQSDPFNPFNPVKRRETFDLLNVVGALLATLVVWPWRAVTNRWPVIAYVPDDPEGNLQMHRTAPMRRAQAKAVARDWAEHIRRYGEPPAQ